MARAAAAQKVVEPEAEVTLRSEAQAALQNAGGDVTAATEALTARVLKDPDFISIHMSDVVKTACYQAVASVMRSERRVVWTTPQPTSVERRAQVNALAAGGQRTLMDFPLPGGKKLGEAFRPEVAEAATLYGSQARDMAWKSRWLELVAQSLPDGKPVRVALTPERLAELQQEVGNTVSP